MAQDYRNLATPSWHNALTAQFQGTSLIVMSDIHLKSPDCKRGTLLLNALESIAQSDAECLVLLGDIFDFCLGSSRYFRQKFSPIGRALSRIAQTGTRVIFFEGNHEFDLSEFGWTGVEFVPEGDFLLELSDGERILLAHGDLVYSSSVYRSFRWVVKSRPVTAIASALPGRLIEGFALTNSDASRSYDRFREINHSAILSAARSWIKTQDCHHGIFGHFHVPYAEPFNSSEGRLLGLDSWDKPNVLVRHGSTFSRIYLEAELPHIEGLRSAVESQA